MSEQFVVMSLANPCETIFLNLNITLDGFGRKGFLLWAGESFPMGDGGKGEFRLKTSAYLGRHDNVVRVEPVMCQPRVK